MAWLTKRGSIYYIKYSVSGEKRKVTTGTGNFQLAKEKLRIFEAAAARGDDALLPTRTPIADVLEAYVRHIRATHTEKRVQSDIYYLRNAFGPVCAALTITSRRLGCKVPKRRKRVEEDGRRKQPVVEASYFERITTVQVASFITEMVKVRKLKPRTANRYREILLRLFNWAMTQGGVVLPMDRNPVSKVSKQREAAPEIVFLTLPQIDEQLSALSGNLQLQVMVARLIYAGLRREELLWLTPEDIDLFSGTYGVIRVHAKTIGGESWMPKTKVNRGVPISSTLRPYIDRWLDHWRVKRRGSNWLFPSPQGVRWDPDNLSSDLRVANRSADLHWGCLHFRHSFGSHLVMANQSLYKVSKLMGNSPEICRRHYAHLLPESLTDSVEFTAAKSTIPLQPAG